MPYKPHIQVRMAERPSFAGTVRLLAKHGKDTPAALDAAYDRDVAYQREDQSQGRRLRVARLTGVLR